MKRISLLSVVLGMAIIFSSVAIEPLNAEVASPTSIQIHINGKEVKSDVSPVIVNNCTMVPLRVIAEHLGCYVRWDQPNRRVIIAPTAEESAQPLPNCQAGASGISIVIDGREIKAEVPPFIQNGYTMLPLRVIGEELGMEVQWDAATRLVALNERQAVPVGLAPLNQPVVNSPALNPVNQPVVAQPNPAAVSPVQVLPSQASLVDPETTIMGEARVSAGALKALLLQNNPAASPELADLYLAIGQQYGIRGDIAFCQAAKETRWWQYGGLVKPFQNNYCGLAATGAVATGQEDLLGADPSRVRYEKDVHGAIFDSPAAGVEAHIQHLYAYACKDSLPAGKGQVDPRFVKPARGCALRWIDLSGKWAVPGYDRNKYGSFDEAFKQGDTYGHSILNNYYAQLLSPTPVPAVQ